MIFLVSTHDVENRMGLPPVAEASKTLNSAIKAAHLRVQSILDTRFDKGSQEDIFLLNRDIVQGKVPNGFFRLRLRYGLLRSDPVPVVTVCERITGFSGTDPLFAPFAALDYKIDMQRGFVYVPEAYEGFYISVKYDYGFAKGTDGKLDPTPPEQVTDGIISYVPAVLEFSVKTSSVGTKVADQNRRDSAAQHTFSVLTPLIRRLGFALDPVF